MLKEYWNNQFSVTKEVVNEMNSLLNNLTRILCKLAIGICHRRKGKIVQCRDIKLAIKTYDALRLKLLKNPNFYQEEFFPDLNQSLNWYKEYEKIKGVKTFNTEKTGLSFSTTRVEKIMDQVKTKDIKYSMESKICMTHVIQLYLANMMGNFTLGDDYVVKGKRRLNKDIFEKLRIVVNFHCRLR